MKRFIFRLKSRDLVFDMKETRLRFKARTCRKCGRLIELGEVCFKSCRSRSNKNRTDYLCVECADEIYFDIPDDTYVEADFVTPDGRKITVCEFV